MDPDAQGLGRELAGGDPGEAFVEVGNRHAPGSRSFTILPDPQGQSSQLRGLLALLELHDLLRLSIDLDMHAADDLECGHIAAIVRVVGLLGVGCGRR